MLKHWLLYYLCLCPLFLCAQTPQATSSGQAKDFFHQEGMKKVDGILPVYQHNGKVYLARAKANGNMTNGLADMDDYLAGSTDWTPVTVYSESAS